MHAHYDRILIKTIIRYTVYIMKSQNLNSISFKSQTYGTFDGEKNLPLLSSLDKERSEFRH